ncbi:PREDICTED: protein TIC 22-like, chloroplastic [Erythranthe guttata]|uniref:protein TIC 22-like, chloroplastic n=1 Tax=Erythranthe guttata TaxID=4155 RepID=UPI00064DDCA1|nr:PREDICTED: protein TIC 22-like, chloroplastic [Erythranthe guttata]|eukprot:XP_012838281.1 PREDICTED: protein TIC 22-like, chloroplastic [Erythranthe guttata]
MNWLKPKEPSSQPPPPLCNALNSLQTHFSNVIRAISIRFSSSQVENRFSSSQVENRFSSSQVENRFASISASSSDNSRFASISASSSDNSQHSADYALSDAEIKKRMAGVSVYKLSNDSQHELCRPSEYGDRVIQFYFLNKPDALRFKDIFICSPDTRIFDAPLTEQQLSHQVGTGLMGSKKRCSDITYELASYPQEKEKQKAGFPDGTFAGVPVFQKDLETALAKTKAPKQRGTVQVAALEDIIQEMKDCSTSKWNDVVFVPPGNITGMDIAFEEGQLN